MDYFILFYHENVLKKISSFLVTPEEKVRFRKGGPWLNRGFPTNITSGCVIRTKRSLTILSTDGDDKVIPLGTLGRVRGQVPDGGFLRVDFPVRDGYRASPDDIEYASESLFLQPGARVRVKASVTQPRLNWGSAMEELKHEGVGLLISVNTDCLCQVEFGLRDPGSTRQGSALWHCDLSEIEVVPMIQDGSVGTWAKLLHDGWTTRLQCGNAVRVPAHISEPIFKWGPVKHSSLGYVTHYYPVRAGDRDVYHCIFQGAEKHWLGKASDLEIAPTEDTIRPGLKVRVRPRKEPKLGMRGVSKDSIGVVRYVNCNLKSFEVYVCFPGAPHWKCDLQDLEPESGALPPLPYDEMEACAPPLPTAGATIVGSVAALPVPMNGLPLQRSYSLEAAEGHGLIIPETPLDERFLPGAIVMLKGLSSAPGMAHNGKKGKILGRHTKNDSRINDIDIFQRVVEPSSSSSSSASASASGLSVSQGPPLPYQLDPLMLPTTALFPIESTIPRYQVQMLDDKEIVKVISTLHLELFGDELQ